MAESAAQRADELFDVVDRGDRVVDRRTRGEVHSRGLLHRAVHVFVFDASGRLFLQKRSMAKDAAPGKWDSSAAGHLDAGEEYDAAALRELGEELGIPGARPPKAFFKLSACPQTEQEFVWIYAVRHEGPFTLHPAEIEKGDWFSPAEVDRWVAEAPTGLALSFSYIWPQFRLRVDLRELLSAPSR